MWEALKKSVVGEITYGYVAAFLLGILICAVFNVVTTKIKKKRRYQYYD